MAETVVVTLRAVHPSRRKLRTMHLPVEPGGPARQRFAHRAPRTGSYTLVGLTHRAPVGLSVGPLGSGADVGFQQQQPDSISVHLTCRAKAPHGPQLLDFLHLGRACGVGPVLR